MISLNSSDLYKCSGCSVCLVNCPSFVSCSDSFNSAKGRLMALKGGAEVDYLKESIESCKDCSLCVELCPEDIDIFSVNREIKKNNFENEFKEVPSIEFQGSGKVLIGTFDLKDFKSLNFDSEFLEDGLFDENSFVNNIIEPLMKCESIVTDNYRFLYYSKKLGKLNNIKGLGELLIEKADFKSGDLFVPSFYGLMSDYKRLFHYYDDEVRLKRGIDLFVDLNRMPFYVEDSESSEIENRILISTKGCKPKRIIVEDNKSVEIFTDIFDQCQVKFLGDIIDE